MTRKHFQIIADVIRELPPKLRLHVACAFVTKLKDTNPNFSVSLFLGACNVLSKVSQSDN